MSKGHSSSVHTGYHCQQEAVDEPVPHDRFLWVDPCLWIDANCSVDFSWGRFEQLLLVVMFQVLFFQESIRDLLPGTIQVIDLMMPADLIQRSCRGSLDDDDGSTTS